MNNKKNTLLDIWEKAFESYKKELEKKPDSVLYKGIVKNTEELIQKNNKERKMKIFSGSKSIELKKLFVSF